MSMPKLEVAVSNRLEKSDCHPRLWEEFAADAWWARLARSQQAVLMLDYDGTLAPFVVERMEAVPYVGVPERLLHLAKIAALRMVLISGRRVCEVRALLPAQLNVEIWGSHGRERLLPDGELQTVPLRPEQEALLSEFEQQARREGLSAGVEKKVGSVALHTRGRSPEQAVRVRQFAASFVDNASTDVELLDFDGGVELRAVGQTKADAVREIVRCFPDSVPMAYLGDDRTDEDAFAALANRASAARILVREESRTSAAQWWLRPPHELLAFLDLFTESFHPECA